MSEQTTGQTPLRVLLASDLSSRCDRATDRAAQLAQGSGGTLVALHVVPPAAEPVPTSPLWHAPWRRIEDQQAAARQRIADDLGDLADRVDVEVRIEYGFAGERIAAVANEARCDIVVTGIARDETLGRRLLGTTVDHLLQRSRIPVLIVRRRVHRPYQRILFTTDLSEASREALRATRSLFPEAEITLLHAYQIPFSGVLIDDEIRAEFRELGERALAEFRNSLPASLSAPPLAAVVECSHTLALVERELARQPDALVVVGSHGSSGVLDRLLGSTAAQLLDAVDGDVLLLPDRRRGDRGNSNEGDQGGRP